MNDKITEIKEKLSAITPDWEYNGNEIVSKSNIRCGIGGFLKDEDNEFAVSAPEYITYLIQELEKSKQLVETKNEALEFYADPESWRLKHIKGNVYFSAVHEDTGEKAREALSIN